MTAARIDPFAPVGRGFRRNAAPNRCEWCGRTLPEQEGVGRRRRYCAQACRQRAYEQRHTVDRQALPADAVVLTADEWASLSDRLFQVRCAAEDVATALAEGVRPGELQSLVDDLMTAATAAERIR